MHFPLILYVCPSVCMSEGGGFAKPFAWRAGLEEERLQPLTSDEKPVISCHLS